MGEGLGWDVEAGNAGYAGKHLENASEAEEVFVEQATHNDTRTIEDTLNIDVWGTFTECHISTTFLCCSLL